MFRITHATHNLARAKIPHIGSSWTNAPNGLQRYLPKWTHGWLTPRPPDWRFNSEYKRMAKKRRRWVVGGGFGLFIVGCFNYKFDEAVKIHGNPGKIQGTQGIFWTRVLFGRTRSRFFGKMMQKEIPINLRPKVYGAFAWWYGANLDEVRYPLDCYRSMSEFFSRNLVDGCRPVEMDANSPAGTMVCPCDATLVNMGEVTRDRIDQIKGATYSISSFLGVDPLRLLDKQTSKLMYAVLYLAPGDYHRFHAPTNMTVQTTRHFIGECLPVFEGLAKRLNDLFVVNERVVMSGNWDMGAMHYAAVAAYNVGGIVIPSEPKMKTNQLRNVCTYMNGELKSKVHLQPVPYEPGEQVGYFKMGSTVVMVFEAPFSFEFTKQEGDKVKMGQSFGHCSSESSIEG